MTFLDTKAVWDGMRRLIVGNMSVVVYEAIEVMS